MFVLGERERERERLYGTGTTIEGKRDEERNS
jgi:hypothetical protein